MRKTLCWIAGALLPVAVCMGAVFQPKVVRELEGPVVLHYEAQDTGERKSVTLTGEEAAFVLDMLRGKASTREWGIPACGFDAETALEISGIRDCLALDTCPLLRHGVMSDRYIGISREEQRALAEILEKYGARYPNV